MACAMEVLVRNSGLCSVARCAIIPRCLFASPVNSSLRVLKVSNIAIRDKLYGQIQIVREFLISFYYTSYSGYFKLHVSIILGSVNHSSKLEADSIIFCFISSDLGF